MSYQEENGTVVLRMSKKDFALLNGGLRILADLKFNGRFLPGFSGNSRPSQPGEPELHTVPGGKIKWPNTLSGNDIFASVVRSMRLSMIAASALRTTGNGENLSMKKKIAAAVTAADSTADVYVPEAPYQVKP